MCRKEIRLVEYWYAVRKSKYLHHLPRKAVWIASGGSAAKRAIIRFAKLPNDAESTPGSNDSLPPRLIVSDGRPDRYGISQRLSVGDLYDSPPTEFIACAAPDVGPEGPSADTTPGPIEVSDTESQNGRKRTSSPPQVPSGFPLPQVPEPTNPPNA